MWPVMIRWLGILFGTLQSTIRTQRELALENLALRQQLAVWKAREPRPRLTEMDRLFWVFLSRQWTNWRQSLHVVKPETVVRWHRQGFRRYWAWKSRRRLGRPTIGTELRDLIRRMSSANPFWGAPRIHGELLKLGLMVAQATVSKYMLRPPRPPSQAWRTFLKNHDLIALDFFTVPTATFRVLFVLVVLSHVRRRLVHFKCHGASERGMDGATTHRGVGAGREPSVSDPGPGSGLWGTIRASGQDIEPPGGGHRPTLALAKCLCGARDWLDSPGMP
jgi:putative transposase